jgi:hypothetical protein
MVQHILVVKPGGSNMITVSDWKALPLQQRVTLVQEGKVQFLDDAGQSIKAVAALKLLAGK